MRHGHLSDIPGNYVSSTLSPKKSESTSTKCPFGQYSAMFKAKQPRSALSAPSSPSVVGRMITAHLNGAAPPQQDSTEAVFSQIADARASGVDNQPDDEFGDIPAGYTYFGQLVVHDLTHSFPIADRASRAGKFLLENLSTPSLDLDTIYGGGPTQCPHLYQPSYLNAPVGSYDPDQYLFYLGRTADPALPENEQMEGGKALDLPRIDTASRGISATTPTTCVTALVYDGRNDDNLILGQLTTQFLLVHNKVASYLYRKGDPTHGNRSLNKRESFELARYFLVKAYRRIVLHDYLKRLLLEPVYAKLLAQEMKPHNQIPIEFLFGVARVGHAMVRAAYTVNTHIDMNIAGLGRLMAFSSSSASAKLPLPADWVVNWSLFLEMEHGDRPQSARRISPFLAPAFVHGDLRSRHTGLNGSLSFHDLWRCHQFGVATGQECAEQLSDQEKIDILKPADMRPTPVFAALHPARNLMKALNENPDFCKNTPLSYYLLQEAAKFGSNGRFLGPLGSHIFARTILYALAVAKQPYETPTGQSELTFEEILQETGILKLRDLLKVADMPDDRLAITIVETLVSNRGNTPYVGASKKEPSNGKAARIGQGRTGRIHHKRRPGRKSPGGIQERPNHRLVKVRRYPARQERR